MSTRPDKLVDLFKKAGGIDQWSAGDWLATLRRAQRTALLGKFARQVERKLPEEDRPPAINRHIRSAAVMGHHNRQELLAESWYLLRVLADLDVPIVFLKGAAYALAGLDVANGRMATDIDILVPEHAIEAVEARLLQAGWSSMKTNEYDDSYYRQWMHEIPPLRHRVRNRVTDVHHTILPRTCRITPDADALIKSAVSLETGGQQALVLCPADMVVHAAIHTFYDGDLNERLRDILDLHELLLQFSTEPGFWQQLADRTKQHEAGRPVFYALCFAEHLFDTPVPKNAYTDMDKPGPVLMALMRWSVRHTVLPNLPEILPLKVRIARQALYMRSHWLRMPPLMLARHLTKKFLMGRDLIRK